MKKSILAVLLVVCMMLAVCAACGGTEEPAAEVSATMAPAAEPEIEAEPVEQTPAEEVEEEAPAAANEEDLLSVVQDLYGRSVEELYAAIGEPNGVAYSASCLVLDGEDGLLYYDDFIVATVKYADGTEMVMGVF